MRQADFSNEQAMCTIARSSFSQWMFILLIASALTLSASLINAQESNADALHINEQGDVVIGERLTVKRDVAIRGGIETHGSVLMHQSLNLLGDLQVGKKVTLKDDLEVGGQITAKGSVTVDKSLIVSDSARVTKNLKVNGDATLDKSLKVDGDLTVGKTLKAKKISAPGMLGGTVMVHVLKEKKVSTNMFCMATGDGVCSPPPKHDPSCRRGNKLVEIMRFSCHQRGKLACVFYHCMSQ